VKKIDRVFITIAVGKGDDALGFRTRETVIRTLRPVTLRTLKPECELAFKKTIELMCKEADL
jgi:hypothetical protein